MEENLIASLVLIGYPYKDEGLELLFESNKILKSESFMPIEAFSFIGDIIPPKEFIENLKKTSPVRVYQNDKKTVKITLIIPEQKLIIECIDNFNKFKDIFKNICEQFIQNKTESIFTIGLNFNARCKNNKLHLFNDEISKIKGWNDDTGYNNGFQLVLPLKDKNDKNLTSTYTIFKKNENNEENEEKRIYTIDVNFDYKLQNLHIPKKEFLKNFITKDIDMYFNKYQENREIMLTIGQNNDNKL